MLSVVIVVWMAVILNYHDQYYLVSNYWYFFILGILGALIANSTGAGGGVVFVPFFTSLSIAGTDSLGTSILIQCFGMTAGTVSWLTTSHIVSTRSHNLNILIAKLLIVCGLACIPGVIFGQYVFSVENTESMLLVFKIFSSMFGAVLLYMVLFHKGHNHTKFHIDFVDYFLLVAACFIGALLTAWISIAVGEVVALMLILRKYPTMVAIALGVSMSSLCVLTAAFYHVVISNSVIWEIVIFAAPGAIIGGTFAYLLSEKLGPARLKVFFATWILATGIAM